MDMSSLTAKITEKLTASFSPAKLHVVDNSDDHCSGAKLEVLVVSKSFDKIPLLQRHRKVNTALKDFMDEIHALTVKAYTPAQYESMTNLERFEQPSSCATRASH